MKLLFDENLSFHLPRVLADLFPESLHVEDVGLDQSDDEAIRHYAVEHGLAIVTKDADFAEHCLVKGAPSWRERAHPFPSAHCRTGLST